MRFRSDRLLSLALIPALATVGCSLSPTASPTPESGSALRGNLHGGQQPVANAHIYLLAANTTGYGQPSVSLLDPTATGNADSIGAYVLTDSFGNFSISGEYTCTPNTQVYLYALGGNPGAGPNSAVGAMAILGNCPASGNFLSSVPYVSINEVSTVAAAFAISGFATDATHVSSSGTALAQTGIANAFANAANLVSLGDGYPLATTPAGNGVVPFATINTLANVLAACNNTSGPTSAGCSTLFSNTLSGGLTGSAPTDTASAAINIAHNPGVNVANLFFLPPPTAPFTPTLVTQPGDFTLPINFSGGGLAEPTSIAIDAMGNVWATNYANNAVTQLSSSGAPISPSDGYNGETSTPVSVAIDLSGNAWVANSATSSLTEYSSTGTPMSPAPFGFTGGGLIAPQGVAIDANGDAWVASFADTVSEFAASGNPLSPPAGFTGGGLNGPGGIAIDSAGSVWIPNCSSNGISGVTKFSSSGVPMSPVNGFLGGGIDLPFSIAIDASGNAWVANAHGSSLSLLSPSGSPISPSSGFTGGGLNVPFAVAIDGAGNAWAANFQSSTVSELSNAGNPISPATGYAGSSLIGPQAIALDGSGNVWIANSNAATLTELVGAAVPVVTPIAAAVQNNSLGARP